MINPAAGDTQFLESAASLEAKFGSSLDQLRDFYGVSPTAGDSSDIFRSASDLLNETADMPAELAVVRSALGTLKRLANPS